MGSFRSNIWKYYAFEFLMGLWFILPIGVIYLRHFNINYGGVGLLEFIVSFIVIVTEIPTGVFSDFIGKKTTLFFACLFWAAAMFVIGTGTSLPLFAVGFALWGISDSLLSGTKSAFLYDSLKRIGEEKRFLHIKGISHFIIAVATIAASLSGAYIYKANVHYPWLFFGICAIVASIFILTAKEPFKNHNKFTILNQIQHTKQALQFVFTHRVVRWIVIFSAFIVLPFTVFNNIIKQPYILEIGFEIIALGWITALIYGASGIFSLLSPKIESLFGEKGSFLLITLVHGFAFAALGLFKFPAMLSIIILIFLIRAYKDNVIEYYINKHASSEHRATVLSIQNLAVNVLGALYVLAGGFFLDIFGLSYVLLAMGILTLIFCMIYIITRFPSKGANNVIE